MRYARVGGQDRRVGNLNHGNTIGLRVPECQFGGVLRVLNRGGYHRQAVNRIRNLLAVVVEMSRVPEDARFRHDPRFREVKVHFIFFCYKLIDLYLFFIDYNHVRCCSQSTSRSSSRSSSWSTSRPSS